jgi:hypothetical protein
MPDKPTPKTDTTYRYKLLWHERDRVWRAFKKLKSIKKAVRYVEQNPPCFDISFYEGDL